MAGKNDPLTVHASPTHEPALIHDWSFLHLAFFIPEGVAGQDGWLESQQPGVVRWLTEHVPGMHSWSLLQPRGGASSELASLLERVQEDYLSASPYGVWDAVLGGRPDGGVANRNSASGIESCQIVLQRWHDTASWLIATSRRLDERGGLEGQLDELRQTLAQAYRQRWRLDEDRRGYLGETLITRVTTTGPYASIGDSIVNSWLGAVTSAEFRGARFPSAAALCTSLLQDRARYYRVAPPEDPSVSGPEAHVWHSLQLVPANIESEVDDLTVNEIREMEGYSHKIARIAQNYAYDLRPDLMGWRSELKASVRNWSENFPVRDLAAQESRLEETTRSYFSLSDRVMVARNERTSLQLNLSNLESTRSRVGEVDSAGAGQAYGYFRQVGERTLHQIEGDLEYVNTLMHLSDAVLGAVRSRLEIQRQDQAQREALDQSRVQSKTVKALHREAQLQSVLSLVVIVLTLGVLWDAIAHFDRKEVTPQHLLSFFIIVCFVLVYVYKRWPRESDS